MGILSGKGGRLAVAGGASLLLLSAIAAYFASGPRGLSSRDVPKDAGQNSPGSDRTAGRSRSRELLKDTRFDEPFRYYIGLAPEQLQAEDLYLLGMACLKRDRDALGWSALEAARRLDPKHRQTSDALEQIQARLGKAAGKERSRLHRAADIVELLSAARRGAPLGLLVLGLVRYADSAEREEEFLDRLSLKPRAVVGAVIDSSSALKLVARLLLETGRPKEAMELLHSTPPKREGEDHEIAWLMSRAALQLDDHQLADEMLAQSSGFGDQDTSTPEPAPFVGSKKCGECHRAIFRAQQGSSRHATTIWRDSGLKDIPLPAEPVRDPSNPGITHTFHRGAPDRIELESAIDDKVSRAIIAYAIGSGHHGMTMIGKDPSGTHYELRISYYANGQAWDRTKTSVK